jgi:SAM-dependent methyltransferase
MSSHRTKRHPVHGFRQLDPIPTADELGEFYQSKYYELIRRGGRAPELRRLRRGGAEATRELGWLQAGLYEDIATILNDISPGRRVLDVGCGTGDFVAFAVRHHFDAAGLDPAAEVVAGARKSGLDIHQGNLEDLVHQPHRELAGPFDTIAMLNVLEHVPDPVAMIENCRSLLNPGGILAVRVPNDFSELQESAAAAIGKNHWWVVSPDHINYFDFESLERLLENLGFDVVISMGDFPMEVFLLMGHDYVGDPEVGPRCHEWRVRFDLNLDSALRQKTYRALAAAGIGRNCLVFGRLRS